MRFCKHEIFQREVGVYVNKVLLWLCMPIRITTLAELEIITSLASTSVLVNVVELQQDLQETSRTVPAHVIWEGDAMVPGKAPLDGTLCVSSPGSAALGTDEHMNWIPCCLNKTRRRTPGLHLLCSSC